ncbi:MAG: DUF3604 domain-containing protein, partial [Halioglobus sp.]|nr:DUF3604 domain-containing protein [Halioglobus sp.]
NCTHFNALNNPYFGDTHVHTTFSVDAFTQGADTTPEQAYEFAQGTQIGLHPFDINGNPTRFAQIDRPLDFAMVSDHAEFFGEYAICLDVGHPDYSDPMCVLLRERTNNAFLTWNQLLGTPQANVSGATRFDFCGPDGSACTAAAPTTWQRMQQAAAQYYDRSADCEFTTFVGYEWTGAPLRVNGNGEVEVINLHRNVMFRNSVVPNAPASYLDVPYREQLYDRLDAECLDADNGSNECDVLVIPHNTNLSQGVMLDNIKPDGNPYNFFDALKRVRFEPLIEVMQHKGQSECLASNDELCGFELIPWGHIAGNFLAPTTPLVEGTVRDALRAGLETRESLNVNPFKFGMIGSTDTHLGTPGLVQESAAYPGHGGASQGGGPVPGAPGITDTAEFNPGGLAVVWAPQNSRAALFDAMRRREVYATSGPRHIVRFFGGYELPSDICSQQNPVQVAYNNGVPMGGKLPFDNPNTSAPKFMVSASKDVGVAGFPGNDLQRIQVIKGWTDATGTSHEQVYEVAGDPNNGASVDVNTCATTGTGFVDLCEWWEDPNWDADQNAFYYARVVENPSCRWSQQQCITANPALDCGNPGSVPAEWAACCDEDIPKTIQERSWTSPIWYDKAVDVPGC